jgi:N-acetylglucosaminyl-diphospho-decaprenol L-rhamnosyltransferase
VIPLLIIVVNYRTPGLTIDCLRSLEGEIAAIPGAKVVVVENASGDDSPQRIAHAIETNRWGSWATLAISPVNGGFAAGNNVGWRAGRALGSVNLVLLLNSDTVVHKGTLAHCVSLMHHEPTIGVMSCRLQSQDGSTQAAARGYPTPLRQLLGATSLPWKAPRLFGWADAEQPWWNRGTDRRDVEWLGGAFMLLRGDLVDRIGLFDEDFFFYGEDIELCHRVKKARMRCHYDPRVSILHLGGSSSDPSRMPASARSVHAWRGRYLVQRKCYGRAAELLVRAVDTCSYAVRMLGLRLTGRSAEPRYSDLRDVLRLLCGRLMHPAP